MKIVFSEKFFESDYASDAASVPGRLEAIVNALRQDSSMYFTLPQPADQQDILRAHSQTIFDEAKADKKRFEMAMLAAGASIQAAESGCFAEPAFACVRPPGHHASRNESWGYCVFCNMAVALLSLKSRKMIDSAFVLDFDAHTGDGTKDVLSTWNNCYILNPYQETSDAYMKEIQTVTAGISEVGIVAICAGFDTYEKDVGRKLSTFDFYQIGFLMKQFALRASGGRRFAVLEGGYYLPDLGKNVLAFCQGFQ